VDPERYDRQMRMPELGLDGQRKLAQSRVLVVGAGGLGSPVILYLAAAGVGTLGVADGDVVALSNLNRQILHRTADLDAAKTSSAARAAATLNPEIQLELYRERLDLERAAELAASYDLLIDASDSFASKYLLSDAAVRAGRPLLHAGVERMAGQIALLATPDGPCLRCIFPEAPADPDEPRAIVGAAAGVLGCLQAVEAIKLLAGLGRTLERRMMAVDLWHMEFHLVAVQPDPSCPSCGRRDG